MSFRLLHIDADFNGAGPTVARYLMMGVPRKYLANPERFRYVEARSESQVRAVVADMAEWKPKAVLIDGVAPLVALFGGSNNDGDDYARVYREAIHPFADLGALVVTTDNLAKSGLDTGYASGTTKKRDLADGVYYAVRLIEPMRAGEGGAASLTVLKDRHGAVEAISQPGRGGSLAAVFRMDSRSDTVTWDFHPGRDPEARASDEAENDLAFVLALDELPTGRGALQAIVRAKSADGKGWSNDRAATALRAARESRTTFDLPNKTEI